MDHRTIAALKQFLAWYHAPQFTYPTAEQAALLEALAKAMEKPIAYRREWDGDVSDLGQWIYVEELSCDPNAYKYAWEPLFSLESAP